MAEKNKTQKAETAKAPAKPKAEVKLKTTVSPDKTKPDEPVLSCSLF